MSRSKKNWDELVDFEGNYVDLDKNVGVARLIAGDDIILSPPSGIGSVVVSVDRFGEVVLKGNGVSDLDNDVGYLTEVEKLNDILDVNTPTPAAGQVLTWTGTEWTNRDSAAPDSFRYRGKKNVAVDFPEPDPQEGWTYIQDGQDAATPNAAWVGITTESVDNLDLVVYATNQWTVVKGAFDVISFQDLNADNAPAPQPGEPGGYLSYDPNTATFTLYPADMSLFPDASDPAEQAGTLDERYVLKTGDTMTGDLALGSHDLTANDVTLTGSLTTAKILSGLGDIEVYSGPEQALTVSTHTDGNAYLRLENDPVGPRDAVTLSYLETELQELESDSDSTYVKKAGDEMTGGLIVNDVNNIGITVGAGGHLHMSQYGRVYANEVWSLSSTTDLNVRSGADLKIKVGGDRTYFYQNMMYSGFEPTLDHAKSIVHKEYVTNQVNTLQDAIDQVQTNVNNLDILSPGDADAKYLQEIVVQNTNTLPAGQNASVSVANKNEFTFGIPTGAEGPEGQKGDKGGKGDRGSTGADGTGADGKDGQKGVQGQKGEPGATGTDGSKGTKGQKGNTGASGSGGSFVTRGNSGSNIRIYYSNNRYYIAGTS